MAECMNKNSMCSKNLLFLELAFYRSIQPRCSVNTSIPTNHSKFEPIATSLPFYCSRAVWQEQLCFKIQVSLDHLRAQLVTWTKAESQWSGGFKRYGSRGMIFSMVGRINVEGESGHHLSLPRSHRHSTRLL